MLYENLNVASPQSLLSLSAEIACRNVGNQAENLKILPTNLKGRILRLMSKRGLLNANSLASLLSHQERTLDLSESSLDDDCLAATRKCQYLQKLNLNPGKNQIHEFSSKALLDLFPNFSILSELHMRRCPAVSDEVIERISRDCVYLTQLDVGGCPSLTDKSLYCIADGLSKLKSLNISRSQVTDDGLTTLSRGKCNHCISELLVNECPGVTGKGVSSIFNYCTSMKYFFFHGCPISENVQQLLEFSPQNELRQIAWTIY